MGRLGTVSVKEGQLDAEVVFKPRDIKDKKDRKKFSNLSTGCVFHGEHPYPITHLLS